MARTRVLSRYLGWILLGLAVILIYVLRAILVPFFLALVFAFLTMPLVDRLARRLPRTLAAVVVFLVCFLGGAAAFVWFGMQLVHQVLALADYLTGFFQTHDLAQVVPFLRNSLPPLNLDWKSIAANASHYALQALRAASGAVIFLFSLFIVPVYSFYLLKDGHKLVADFKRMIPGSNRDDILAFLQEVNQILRNFVRGQITIAGLDGLLAMAGLTVLGVNYSILLGTFVALTALIPFIGKPLGFAPALIIACLCITAWAPWPAWRVYGWLSS
jgi:predicted PurR-regulated permease PerM